MSKNRDTESGTPDHISIQEQARQGLITRWNEMRSLDSDITAFQIKFIAMFSELSFLMSEDEIKAIKKTLKDGSVEMAERISKALEFFSPIFYERVVNSRWDMTSGVSQGWGEAAKSSQQTLLNIFWGFDVLSIEHVYNFIKKLELILMNEADYRIIFADITYQLHRWEQQWGEFPIGVPKAIYMPDIAETKKRGPDSEFEKAYWEEMNPDFDRTGVDEKLDFQMSEFMVLGKKYFQQWIDGMDQQVSLRIGTDESKFYEPAKDDEDPAVKIDDLYEAYKKKPNFRFLLFGNPLRLLAYRNTYDYQMALRGLHFILMKVFTILKICDVYILRAYIQYEDSTEAMVSTFNPKRRKP